MTIQELYTLHHICVLERTQLLTIWAMSVQSPQLPGHLLTGNSSKFLNVEDSTTWLYVYPQMLPPLYEADVCIDRLPNFCWNTVIYMDHITRQTFKYVTLRTCNNNLKGMALDPGNDEHYVLNPKSVLRATSTLCEPKRVQSA